MTAPRQIDIISVSVFIQTEYREKPLSVGYRFLVSVLVGFWGFTWFLSAQDRDPEPVEKKPLQWEWPLRIINGFSSNFGEYRSTHFHAGIDLRTFQKNGFPVFAVADGIVEVIRKERRGTGLGVVIRHDNGYRSFTYHLEALREDLQLILEEVITQSGRSYPGNIELKKLIRLKAGEMYAFSGESGSGFPHLHFELRNAAGDSVNPFLFLTSPLADTNVPIMNRLFIRARDASLINLGKREWNSSLVADSEGIYHPKESLLLDGPTDWLLIGEDISDTGRPVAPYTLRFSLDKEPLIDLCFKELNRSHNRQLGLIYDREQSGMGHYAFNLFAQPEASLLGMDGDYYDSVWTSLPLGWHEAVIELGDMAGNLTLCRVPFYFVPQKSLDLALSLEKPGSLVLMGEKAILPFTIRLMVLDRAGRKLISKERIIQSFEPPVRFDFDELQASAATAVFEGVKDDVTVWSRFIALQNNHESTISPSPDYFFNRDVLTIFYPDRPVYSRNLTISGQKVFPLKSREVRDGLFQIYRPHLNGRIKIEGLGERDDHYLLALKPGQANQWEANGYRIEFRDKSVNLPRAMMIQTGVAFSSDEGYPLCSVPIALRPGHLPLLESAKLTLTLASQPDSQELGFFARRHNSKTWSHLPTRIENDRIFTTHFINLGVDIALMRDIFPPVIKTGYSIRRQGKPVFMVGVSDKGKGIDHTRISAVCGRQDLPIEYDPDRNRLEIQLGGLARGTQKIQIVVTDYAGLRANKTFDITIKSIDE